MQKFFEADTTSLSCPPGYQTKSPYHRDLVKFWPRSKILCLHENAQARRNLKPDKWYVICGESTCESCFLDRMKNSVKWNETKFVKLDYASIVNDTFTAHLTVLESDMRFNISLEPENFGLSLLNVTIGSNEKNAVVEQPGVSRMISAGSLIALRVKPWLTNDASGCTVGTDSQTIFFVISTSCCEKPSHPNVKIWIDVSSSSVVNFSFYDTRDKMKKMWAYEVDQSATILKDAKIFEADTTSLSCPPGYQTKSPYHRDLVKFWNSLG
uniref:Uncharacterized protein n=1 Tax=Romanomermis culicivorax TaxID=13658 RepID=A0A915KFB1_ROMCU